MENEQLIKQLSTIQTLARTSVNLDESDSNLKIDWETRQVQLPPSLSSFGVINDHLAKKLVLEMDRYVNGVDLASHTFAIHYINAKTWKGNWDEEVGLEELKSGIHPIIKLDLTHPDKILCIWEITNSSTKIAGKLGFALHIYSIENDAFTYHISTVPTVKNLDDTVNATEHGRNVLPDEAEVYIQMMTDLSIEIDKKIEDFTASMNNKIDEVNADIDSKLDEMDALVKRAEDAADKLIIEDTLSYESKNAVQNKVLTPLLFDLDRFKASAIIQKAKGRSIVIKDSAKAGIPGMRTLGKSEQRKTTGAQLFDASKLGSKTAGGATVTNNGDGSFTVSGSGNLSAGFSISHNLSHEETVALLKVGTLRINAGSLTMPYFYVELINSTGSIGSINCNNTSIGITADMLNDASFYMKTAFYASNGTAITPGTIKPMLYFDGDSDGTWEPYTGNMPAPNPQYPQPIVNAGQKLAEGWQLANLPDVEDVTTSGITWSCKNGVVTAKGTSTNISSTQTTAGIAYNIPVVAGNYTVSGTHDNVYVYAGIQRADGTTNYVHDSTFKLDGTENYCRLFCQVEANKIVDITIYPMLNVGTTAKPWEPYTGGVKAAYDVGIETEVLGGNLFDGGMMNATANGRGITIVNNNDGSFTASGTKTETGGVNLGSSKTLMLPAGTYTMSNVENGKLYLVLVYKIDGVTNYVQQNVTFTLPEDVEASVYIQVGDGYTSSITIRPMLNKGTKALPYQPYTKQSLTINTPNGLPGIPVTDASLANYIDADGKMWVCDTREWERGVDVKRVDTLTIGKTDYLREHTIANVYKYTLLGTLDNCIHKTLTVNVAMCDKYLINVVNVNNMEHGEFRLSDYLYFKNTEVSTLEELKALFETNPVRILYPLATPIETPIPEEEMAAWRAMHSNEPTTTILSDADVEVDYVTDTKTYIDNQIAAIAAATVSAMLAGSEV